MKLLAVAFCFLLFTLGAGAQNSERWIHPSCTLLECTKNGPFIQQDDGTLVVVDGNALRTSTDGGKTWSERGPDICSGMKLDHEGHVGLPLRTRDGTIVIWYLNFDQHNFAWDEEKKAPKAECILESWVIRSTDGGKTWVDNQRLLDGYNADSMGFIQTRNGNLVLVVEHLAPDLKRWVSCSFVSKDEGKTWKQSNLIDLGGHGHHDGAVEPMVVELEAGRLMMLIRTGLDQFWKAYSEDDGQNWRVIKPGGVEASSAPGWIQRLESGRLALVWNRLGPEGEGPAPKSASGGQASEYPASWYREELSLSFSEDNGDTWTEPAVIARQPKGQLAYPYLMERAPGELWVFTRYTFYEKGKIAPPLAIGLQEADFVRK